MSRKDEFYIVGYEIEMPDVNTIVENFLNDHGNDNPKYSIWDNFMDAETQVLFTKSPFKMKIIKIALEVSYV